MVISGCVTTVSTAVLEVAPAPVWVDEITLVVLFLAPAVVPVTVTLMVQFDAAPSVPPLKLRVLLPLTNNVPPQTGVLPFTAVMPDGSVSVKATPVNAAAVLLLVRVNDMVEVSPMATVVGENDFAIVGTVGATVIVAVLLTVPVPPCVELTAVVVLFLTPAVAPVTVTAIVQDEPAAIVPPVKVSRLPPLTTKLPPQTVDVPFTAVKPDGKGSVNATPVKPTVLLGLFTVIFSVAVPASAIADVENDFEIVGGALTTITATLLGFPAPRLEVNVLVWLDHKPSATPVTVTSILQLAFAANAPPVKLNILPPVTVSIPPQVLVVPFAAVSPVGSGSVKLSAVTAVPVLVMVKRMVAVPFNATSLVKNDLAIEGRPTNRDAVFEATPVSAVGPVALIALVVLFLMPAVAPVTVTLIMQFVAANKVPPDNVTVCIGDMPAMTSEDPVPHTFDVVPLTAVKPNGKVSTTLIPVKDTVLGLLTVKRMVVMPPVLIAAAVNSLAISGGVKTFKVAVAGVSCTPALLVCTAPVELK